MGPRGSGAEGAVVDERRAMPVTGSAGQEAARLRMLEAVDDVLSDAELLPFVLNHAMAGIGGLGGMVHRVSPEDGSLRLAAVVGLPKQVALAWEKLDREEPVAPAQALRADGPVWLPVSGPEGPDTGQARDFPAGGGLVSVPLRGPHGPLGSLSVLTPNAVGPSEEQRAFLLRLAAGADVRLAEEPEPTGPLAPTWWQVSSGAHLEEAMGKISIGSWVWELNSGRIHADDVALAAIGLDPATFDGSVEAWSALLHPDDAMGVLAEIDRAIAEHRAYSMEYRICRPDGRVAWLETRGYVSYADDGTPERMSGTLWETTETRQARDAVDRAMRHMSDGFLAIDDEWNILYCNLEAERVLGGNDLAGRPLFEAVPGALSFRLRERYRQASAEGRPVGADVRSPASLRWYHMRLVPVPGGLTVYFTDVTERRAAEAERERAARAAEDRAAKIGGLTGALAQAMTADDVTRVVRERLMPLFGASGMLMMALEPGRLHVLGSSGYRPNLPAALNGMRTEGDSPVARLLRHREAYFVSTLEELRENNPELARVVERFETESHAWAFLPLIATGRSIGFCSLAFHQPTHLSQSDRTLIVALSGLVAHALERARLYDAEHSRAQELQRGMLPQSLPALPAVTPAARYLPAGAGAGAEVGGDWYDVIPLSSERVALVIGDVMGHGVSEAVTMGRLRTAVHTLAGMDIPPAELLSRLSSLVSGLGDDFYATCLYGVYDPTTRLLTFASAGHPPLAVVGADGSVVVPRVQVDPPLGVAEPPLTSVELEVAPDSVLALYTDGLVESAQRDIEVGMDLLAASLTAAVAPPSRGPADQSGPDDAGAERAALDRLCESLIKELLPPGGPQEDDAALLVIRTHALTGDNVAQLPLPEEPAAARQARAWARDQLEEWGLDELSMTTQSLLSELVGNVVRHAKGPLRLRLLRGRVLTCEVYDGSPTTPRIRHAAETDEDGRGLQMVAAMSHRWGARYTASGKCIWTEQLLPGEATEAEAEAA